MTDNEPDQLVRLVVDCTDNSAVYIPLTDEEIEALESRREKVRERLREEEKAAQRKADLIAKVKAHDDPTFAALAEILGL